MTTPSSTINKLRALTQIDIQSNWRYSSQDLSPEDLKTDIPNNWQKVELNPKGYIIWDKGSKLIWLGQKIIVPKNLQGYPLAGLALRLAVTWWAADAKIFVNGELVQAGDLFDSSARVLLNWAVTPGEEIIVLLRLVSPGHDIGGLMRSLCVYEVHSQNLSESTNSLDPGFVADELEILHIYIDVFAPEKLHILETAIAKINWALVSDKAAFDNSLSQLRENLLLEWGVGNGEDIEKEDIRQKDQSLTPITENTVHLLGHAHLDMAWLWTVTETWAVAERTFESVLKLQAEFPDLTFCHSTPALYAWIEENRPNLFNRIKAKIALGKWEVVGGMWVEPELNLIDGESIVRQILYAQRYVKAKFGNFTKIAWLPDSFGFTWQLPQLLKQGGIEYFVTQKLHWNDTTKFPHSIFWWQSPDGSKILSLISPPNTAGVMDTNPITMGKYAIDWEKQTGLKDTLWLPGVGDHGGGPTRDMLEIAQRWQNSPFFPKLKFTTAITYLDKIQNQTQPPQQTPKKPLRTFASSFAPFALKTNDTHPNQSFPTWNDELYLEFHRGCYTTHADQKYWNRRCEGLLYQAELWASLAAIVGEGNFFQRKDAVAASRRVGRKGRCKGRKEEDMTVGYPKVELEEAWKKVLFNQFHDILPGTSIGEVFVEANRAWQDVAEVAQKILQNSIGAIASHILLPSPPHPDAKPIFIFNCLNWARSQVVSLSLSSLAMDFTREMGEWGDNSINPAKVPNSGMGNLSDGAIFTTTEFGANFTPDTQSSPNPVHPSPSSSIYIDGQNLAENPVKLEKIGEIPDKYPFPSEIWQIYDTFGVIQPSQRVGDSLLFYAESVPGVGYKLFWLVKEKAENLTGIESESEKSFLSAHLSHHDSSISRFWQSDTIAQKDWVLENNFLRVRIDEETGNISSIFDKVNEREVLGKEGGGNELQAFKDSGQYWDAWNIDPNYETHRLAETELVSIAWLERGKLQSRIRVIQKLGKSEFCQDYILDWESPLLKIATRVDWQEDHVLVKAAFPLNIETDEATYEIPCGAIARSTKPETPAQKAKWEVPALRWADLSEFSGQREVENQNLSLFTDKTEAENPTPHTPSYGVSIINDSKYGYDAKPSQLRLTLLRSPTWPDPDCDTSDGQSHRGIHQFTYAIYPHRSTWQAAHTVRRGYELNLPLLVLGESGIENYRVRAGRANQTGNLSITSIQNPPVMEKEEELCQQKQSTWQVTDNFHSKPAPDISNREIRDKISSHLLPHTASLLNLEAENLILIAFKQSEDNPQEWILRCYECHGETAKLSCHSHLDLKLRERIDLLERSQKLPDDQLVHITPWQIASFLLTT
ncbi:MAG TPA: alpha-mannosidase [Cyanobacteria bacterium UBA11149]|nr:alpha-mannosidase [Cyanobacteria bacterium UBA11366]HBR72165.1 alpha-mannosidase [Cyanobacteria bacterium UBA11159]HBS71015.1 alpha-mannosidase [Cyanobacteria bacterium UBA11153]HBW88369.1 alpha-mannosidase [Cyanobacteria bacterium UBA11149]